jgi:P22_AR N-terminal domain.
MSVHFLLQQIHKVNVLGTTLAVLVDDLGNPTVALQSVTEAIGLPFGQEFDRLKADRRFGAKRLTVRTNQGETLDEVVLPLTKLHAFLFTVDSSQIDAVVAARLELFQNECVDVLNDYWNKGVALNLRKELGNTESQNYRDARKLSRPALVEAVKRLCSYAEASGTPLDHDDAYHSLICFCWDRLGRGPMKSETEEVDTKFYGYDSYLLSAMERSAVRLIDLVIQEEHAVNEVLQYLHEQIENDLSKIGERAFEVLETK